MEKYTILINLKKMEQASLVGVNHFITNFHVINSLLHAPYPEDVPQNRLENEIVLSQEGNSSVLKVKRVLAVSALYDLVLFEMEEDVIDYLSPRENPPESSENLFLIAYLDGGVTKIRKTGDISYEGSKSYFFPVDHSDLGGASGSPVLDEQGLIVGVTFIGLENLLGAIKINYLKEFISGNIGLKCSGHNSARVCIEEETQNLKELLNRVMLWLNTGWLVCIIMV